jgi:uncharacterized protein
MSYAGLIVKCTRVCNLRCHYCHDWRTGRDQMMRFPVLAQLISRALNDPGHSSVDFIWHGGEPTLLPLRFFEQALYIQSKFRRPGQRVANILQTNATRLTPEWIGLLKDYQFGVGISLDGPAHVHDNARPFASGRNSFNSVMNSMRTLNEAKVPFTLLMVIDDQTLRLGAKAVFDFILEHGIRNVSCIAAKPNNQPHAQPCTPATHYATPTRMAGFLGDLFEQWLDHGDTDIKIRELDAVRHRLNGGRAGTCTLAGGCLGRYYLVEPDGDIAHCDLFLGDSAYNLGSVLHQSFEEIREGEPMRRLTAARAQVLENFKTCPHFVTCNGWCPHEWYLSQRHNDAHQSQCCGLSELIERVRSSLTSRGLLATAIPHGVPLWRIRHNTT